MLEPLARGFGTINRNRYVYRSIPRKAVIHDHQKSGARESKRDRHRLLLCVLCCDATMQATPVTRNTSLFPPRAFLPPMGHLDGPIRRESHFSDRNAVCAQQSHAPRKAALAAPLIRGQCRLTESRRKRRAHSHPPGEKLRNPPFLNRRPSIFVFVLEIRTWF